MKKLYIKFTEGDINSLNKAVNEAKKLGYKKWKNQFALEFEGEGLLQLDESGEYFTTSDIEEILIKDGYTEHKLTMKKLYIKFKEGDTESLNEAMQEAEKLGYKKWDRENPIQNKYARLLAMNESGIYFTTTIKEKILIEVGYTEHKIEDKNNEEHLQSTQADMGRYVTQIIHFSQGNKRTIKGIDTHSIKQGQFTKFKTKTGILISINDNNVDMIETFSEDS